MQLPLSLLQKYSKPGPRYTSYPTAPYFSESFGEAEWQAELAALGGNGRDLSLYVHIPFCDTLCWYCGCNMIATRNYGRATEYLGHLFREIDAIAAQAGEGKVARQLHWGGGTPTYLHPDDIRRLHAHLASRFVLGADAEQSCELDPRELTREHLRALRESGINRVSLGVQDLDPTVQQAVNRVQPESLIREVYGWCREEGFQSVNMDLMVGLPHQTTEGFRATLEKIVALRPDRLAVFNYAHVPWMKKHQTLIQEAALPDLSTRLGLQQLIMEALTAAGYVYIGMDHYARPDDEIVLAQKAKTLYRNFQGYTTHKDCDILAFGASSISQTEDVFVQNHKDLKRYQELCGEGRLPVERGLRVTAEDKLRRDAITRIMCDLELDKAAFGARWNVVFDTHFADALADLQDMAADGLVELSAERIAVTPLGRIFLRNAMPFDAYLRQKADDKPMFSKTL